MVRRVIFSFFFLVVLMASNGRADDTKALELQVKELIQKIQNLEAKSSQLDFTNKEVVTTESPTKLIIKGHVNRAVVWHNNGKNANVVQADVDNSPTRLTMTALGKVSEKTTVGGTIEVALESNSTDRIDVHDANDKTSTFERRKVEVFWKNKDWGEIYLGLGSTASDGTMENTDMSKTTVVSSGSSVSFIGFGIQFFDSNANAKATLEGQKMRIGTIFDSGDGLFRRDRIRYNSPEFYGFSLQTSHLYRGRNDSWDVALKYAGDSGGAKLKAQLAYLHRNDLTRTFASGAVPVKYKQLNGSLGVLFANGMSIFVSSLDRKWHGRALNRGRTYFGKVGYQRQIFEAGTTAFSIDYGEFSGFIFDTRPGFEKDKYKGTSYGAMLVQFLDRVGTELFLGARTYTLTGPSHRSGRYKNVNVVLSGARVRF